MFNKSKTAPEPEHSVKERTFRTSDGVNLHVKSAGKGPALIFLHGWSLSSDYWNDQIKRFSRDYHLIAPDFRAHGHSQNASHGHRISRYAKDVIELLEAELGSEAAVVIGWSMGASVAMAIADLFPNAPIAGYVFVDQTPKILNDEEWDAGVFGITRPDMDAQDLTLRTDYAGFLKNFIPAMFTKPLTESQLNHYTDISLQIPASLAADILIDHCNQDWRDVIANLSVASLAVTGSEYVCCAGVKKMAELSPRVSLKVFEQQSHCMFIERADEFEQTLRAYLQSIGHTRSGAKP